MRIGAFIVTGLWASAAQSYPISPVTLWDLVDGADVVVLAKVRDAGFSVRHTVKGLVEDGMETENWSDGVAHLAVRETWKGKVGSRVSVVYSATMVCPAPPRYEEGHTVVAFLRRYGESYRTVGLSYGTLYPLPEEVDAYKQAVKTAVRLQSAKDVSPERKRDWLVGVASRAATRWHGLYELVPEGDRLHSYYDRLEREPLQVGLTTKQLARLAAGFVDEPGGDVTVPMMLTLLAGYPDPKVDATAVAIVDRVLESKQRSFWIEDAARLTLARLGKSIDPPAPAQGDPLLGGLGCSEDGKAATDVWKTLRPTLRVTPRPIRRAPQRPVGGVGPDTPP